MVVFGFHFSSTISRRWFWNFAMLMVIFGTYFPPQYSLVFFSSREIDILIDQNICLFLRARHFLNQNIAYYCEVYLGSGGFWFLFSSEWWIAWFVDCLIITHLGIVISVNGAKSAWNIRRNKSLICTLPDTSMIVAVRANTRHVPTNPVTTKAVRRDHKIDNSWFCRRTASCQKAAVAAKIQT